VALEKKAKPSASNLWKEERGPRTNHSVANLQFRREEGGREDDSDSSDWARESGGVLRDERSGSGDIFVEGRKGEGRG